MSYYIIKNIKNKLAYIGYTESTLARRYSHHLANNDTTSRNIVRGLPMPTIQLLEAKKDGGKSEAFWFERATEMGFTLVNKRCWIKKPKKKYKGISPELKFIRYYFSGIETRNY